jgi:DNA-directed RNA polymerase alpha subunit
MNFEIKLIHRSDNDLKMMMKNIPISLLNAFRRIMISEIETYSLDFLIFKKNNTHYNDDFLAHRFGLIPFIVDSSTYVPTQNCFSHNCKDCCLFVSLSKENKTNQIVNVYSSDLTMGSHAKTKFRSVAFPEFEKGILLLKLGPGQSIEFKGKLQRGNGRLHSKWSPVSTVFYKEIDEEEYEFTIESTGSLSPISIFKNTVQHWKSKIDAI